MELMVVMSIIAILSAIVFPQVTGVTTIGRQSGQLEDTKTVQGGLDRLNADTSDYPTAAPLSGTDWEAGNLPTGSPTGEGTEGVPYVFDQGDFAGLDWVYTVTVDGVTKYFFPSYVSSLPKHALETVTIGAGDTYPDTGAIQTIEIQAASQVVHVRLTNTTEGALDFPVWAVDKNGKVWNFVDRTEY